MLLSPSLAFALGLVAGCSGLAVVPSRTPTKTRATMLETQQQVVLKPQPKPQPLGVVTTPSPHSRKDSEKKKQVMVWRGVMLGITMCWATNFALFKFGTEALPPEPFDAGPLFVAFRFLIASVACLPFLKTSSPGVYAAGARVGAWCALGYGSQVLALDAFGAGASTTAFLCSLQTVVVAALVSSGKKTMASVAAAIVGVGILCFGGVAHHHQHVGVGDLVALGQALGFGMSYLELEDATRKFPDDAKALASMQCLVVGLASALFAAVTLLLSSSSLKEEESGWFHSLDGAAHVFLRDLLHSPLALASALWMGLVATALTIYLQTEAFKNTPAADASLILVSEPVWATLVAHSLLHETLAPLQLLGGALVIAACALNEGLLDDVVDFGDDSCDKKDDVKPAFALLPGALE